MKKILVVVRNNLGTKVKELNPKLKKDEIIKYVFKNYALKHLDNEIKHALKHLDKDELTFILHAKRAKEGNIKSIKYILEDLFVYYTVCDLKERNKK